jgi:formylglycine-generating enzyme required for sulfatase activity
VVYVTYLGAQSYAGWLGGQLPTASQHKYACKADTKSLLSWVNDQEIADYAHVRARDWLIAKDAYNSKLGSLTGTVEPPVGAVIPEGFIPYDQTKGILQGSENGLVHENSTTYNSAWPVAGAVKPNRWGLYDMIGNVWEWCQEGTQPVICGGSCLAPPEYIRDLESNYIYSYNDKACDVGFRIIVPAR